MERDTICSWPELPFYPIVVPPLCPLCLEHNDVTFLVACVFSVYLHFLLAAASLLSGLFSIHRGWAMVFLFLEIALSWKGNDSSGGRWLPRLQRCFVPKRWSLDQIHEYRRKFVLRASCYASRMLSVSMSLAGCARGETRYVTSLANYERLRSSIHLSFPFISFDSSGTIIANQRRRYDFRSPRSFPSHFLSFRLDAFTRHLTTLLYRFKVVFRHVACEIFVKEEQRQWLFFTPALALSTSFSEMMIADLNLTWREHLLQGQ